MGKAPPFPPLDRVRLQLGGRLLKRGLPSLRTSLFSVQSKEAGQHSFRRLEKVQDKAPAKQSDGEPARKLWVGQEATGAQTRLKPQS